MYTAKDIITAGRITKVEKVTSLSANYYPNGVIFSMFLVPKAATGVEVGDVMIVEVMLPDTNGEYVDVPIVVGDWSPVVFRALRSADGIEAFSDSEDYAVGDLVTYSDVAYRFKTPHTAGDWSSDDVERYPIIDLTKVDVYVAPIKELTL